MIVLPEDIPEGYSIVRGEVQNKNVYREENGEFTVSFDVVFEVWDGYTKIGNIRHRAKIREVGFTWDKST